MTERYTGPQCHDCCDFVGVALPSGRVTIGSCYDEERLFCGERPVPEWCKYYVSATSLKKLLRVIESNNGSDQPQP